MIANYAQVAGFDGRTLTLAFSASGPLVNLRNRPDMMGLLTNTISQVMRQQVDVVITEGGSAPAGGGSPKGERRPQPASAPVVDRAQSNKADASASQAVAPHSAVAASPQAPRHRPEPAPTDVPSDEPPYLDEPPFDPYVDAYPPEDPGYNQERFVSRGATVSDPTQQQSVKPAPVTSPRPETSSNPAPRTTRTFDGPPIAPPPRMTAGMAARQEEVDAPPFPVTQAQVFSRPVSDVPLRPGSTTDSFPQSVQAIAEAETASSTPVVRPQEQPLATPVAPPPAEPTVTRPPSSQPPTTTNSTWGQPQDLTPSVDPPLAAAPAAGQKLSRYQQLMNQSKGAANAPVETSGGSWGQPQPSVPRRQTPQPTPEPEEFVPSDDDIAVEDSALIGVPAIERLLDGMVIEQRDANGNIVEIRRNI